MPRFGCARYHRFDFSFCLIFIYLLGCAFTVKQVSCDSCLHVGQNRGLPKQKEKEEKKKNVGVVIITVGLEICVHTKNTC